MTKTVHCGTFEAERFWRDGHLARLPALPGSFSAPVVEAMDEMLFLFCRQGDVLITAHAMQQAHLDYIRSIGFEIKANRFHLADEGEEAEQTERTEGSIFNRLIRSGRHAELAELIGDDSMLDPFAVLPGAFETVKRYGFRHQLPEEHTVTAVNAKSYSLTLRDKLGIRNIGTVVDSIQALIAEGTRLLESGPFLVKDEYGVSGKGNLTVNSERLLRRIAGYAEREVRERNASVRFILEPLLDKEGDFSCQFKVEPDGAVHILSVQQLDNNGFGFGSSRTPPPAFVERLVSEGYFELMMQIGRLLHQDGYWGHVCVDSMTLKDGSLEPLVEINARKSMSLLKRAADDYLSRHGLKGCLTQWTVGPEAGGFECVLDKLDGEGLLFTPGSNKGGVLPLTSGTLLPAGSGGGAPLRAKGRMYGVAVYREPEDHLEDLIRRVSGLLN